METANTEVKSIQRRNNVEKSTWKTHRYFVDFKVESTSKFPRRIDVIISTWIRLSKSMKFWRTFHVELRRRINGESTRMCSLGLLLIFSLSSVGCVDCLFFLMLHTRFKVNLYSATAWMSRKSLLKTGATSEDYEIATGFEFTTT